jgi:hypothetical protein
MRRSLFATLLAVCSLTSALQCQPQQTNLPGHYMFAWTGDVAHKGTHPSTAGFLGGRYFTPN